MNDFFLQLIRLGIGKAAPVLVPANIDWGIIEDFAAKQGLSAIVLDCVDRLPADRRPPQMLLLNWIGEVLGCYENAYKQYKEAIAQLAHFYNKNGFKMMVLKGYACALDWPKSEHRPCGDIDIWQFGQQKEADEALKAWFKVHGSKFTIDTSHHHHTVFEWMGFSVENHYDFVNVYAHKSSAELEKIFKELGKDATHVVNVFNEKVYLPSPDLHALFLIRHLVSHFASAEISLRQVLDWAFFVENHTQDIDWKWLLEILEKYHMKDFFNCINAICVDDLGFPSTIFPSVQFLPSMKEKVLNDILEPEYSAAEPKGLFNRLFYKWRRWQGNAWKQKMCYGESRWSLFWHGTWAKMLKPSSF